MKEYCNINNSQEEGFVDLVFDIAKVKKKLNGNLYIECFANDDGTNVGFGLEIKSNMKGIVDSNPETFRSYIDGFKLTYLNGVSDNLIKSLLKLYGFESTDLLLNKTNIIECGILSLEPLDFQNDIVKFKCFLDSQNQKGMYAECYINLDLKNRKLYLNEKSSEYRGNIIKYLSL